MGTTMDGREDTSKARWQAPPYSYAEAHALARELGVSETTAAVLVRRGLGDVALASRFLEASETHDPYDFRGMEEVAGLILDHVQRGTTIAVHGDYDVDGVCATALAVRALRALGATVRWRLPSRLEDGYGLSARTVEELRSKGADLLITADCGIGAVDEVALARRLGMEVVVTDHHRPPEQLPDCPVIHPGVCGYPCPDLCATGVMYKLVQALYGACGRDAAELQEELDLVALATVADVVPLVGENRTLVRAGLRALAGTAKPGLRALLRVAGVDPQDVSERTLAFVLAPRINAAGRLYRADAGLELLLTEEGRRAEQIAAELNAVNRERRDVETRILFEAERQLSAAPERREDPAYVLAQQGWHPGVIGIVASRLVERYHRPCVLVALEPSGRGRGSARSIPAYDLHAGLAACARHLERFGGHRMAAGLELQTDRLDLFRAELVEHARSKLRPEDLAPVERVDAVVPGDTLGLGLVEELELLRPFGTGNPGVNLLLPAARVSDLRPMGEGRHARFTVASAGVRTRGVAFDVARRLPQAGGAAQLTKPDTGHDLVARLEANEWRGAVEARLVLRSLHPLDEPGSAGGCAYCACRARGARWWDAVWAELDRPLDVVQAAPSGCPRAVVDRRDEGIVGVLGDLLSSSESILVTCTDISRRRSLVDHELDPGRFGRPPASFMSTRCLPQEAGERLAAAPESALWLVDYAAVEAGPLSLQAFAHVFALDPPPFEHTSALLHNSAPEGDAPAFLHLGWGRAELEFTKKALEHEYGLRAPLTAVYRAVAEHPRGVADGQLEALLAGSGRHPRSPAVAGRCLRILVELGLFELERSSATVRCTMVSDGRANLERSQAFVAYGRRYQEGLRFLSEPAQSKRANRLQVKP